MPKDLAHRIRSSVWGPTSTKLRQNPRYRESAIRAYQLVARQVLIAPPPKVVANSIPKAGTHLLTQLLGGVPRLWYSGVHLTSHEFDLDADELHVATDRIDRQALSGRLAKVRDGQYITAHFGSYPAVRESLRDHGFKHILMVRDPRDIAVSTMFYLRSNARVHVHRVFSEELTTDHDRLTAVITGLPGEGSRAPLQSLAQLLDRYVAWVSDPDVLVVRFEDLVGARGGGDDDAQSAAIRRVLQHCHRDDSDEVVARLARGLFAKHSATFRKGEIGDWANHLSDDHAQLLQQTAGDQMRALGYV